MSRRGYVVKSIAEFYEKHIGALFQVGPDQPICDCDTDSDSEDPG